MRVYIKNGPWLNAVRIELHVASISVNGEANVDEKYRVRAEQLQEEGLIKIRG